MAEPRSRRLFFALWPDAEVRRRMWSLSGSLGKAGRDAGRAVEPDNLHLTLAFLGPVDREMQQCVERAAARVEASPFDMVLDRIGYWKRPRILWVGSEPGPVALQRLVACLNRELAGCGYQAERRPFAPHVTLRRKARPLQRLPLFDPVIWTVGSFCLVESITRAQGPEYRVVRSWPLDGEAPA